MSNRKLGLVEAFKQYQAKLVNRRWAVSALAEDGSLVVSCWGTHFEKGMRYVDTLSQWADNNPEGRELLKQHIAQAQAEGLAVRLVVAHEATAGTRTAEYFHVRPDLVGRIAEFDGDRFVIKFSKQA